MVLEENQIKKPFFPYILKKIKFQAQTIYLIDILIFYQIWTIFKAKLNLI
jgi:hypothetical protein